MKSRRPRLDPDAYKAYSAGTRGEHFAWYARERLVLGQSQWAGKPFILEPDWQAPIMFESLAVEASGDPYWRSVVIIVPRKCAKTTTMAGYGVYTLDEAEGEPEILLAAGSDKQAGRLFDHCLGFRRRNLDYYGGRITARAYIGELAHNENGGKIIRLSSEGDTQHGANPSLVVVDELHVWRTPKLRRSWGALTTAQGARNEAQIFAITTEGEALGREDSILGQLVDTNEALGDLEKHPGITISRDHDARTIVFRFHAVNAKHADPRKLRRLTAGVKKGASKQSEADTVREQLLASVMPANPASWITEEYITRQALSGEVMPSDFLQLHACVAAEGMDIWIPADDWQACEEPGIRIPEKTEIYVGVDAALTHDSACVAWSARVGEKIVGKCMVWAAHKDALEDKTQCHQFVPGGEIRFKPMESWIHDHLNQRYRIREIVYDPRFFAETAQNLKDLGYRAAPMHQGTLLMRGAEQQFHDAIKERSFVHDGNAVLRAHVAATVAEKTDGGWKIRKVKQSKRIDATVAMVMSHSRALMMRESKYETEDLIEV